MDVLALSFGLVASKVLYGELIHMVWTRIPTL